MTQPTVARDVPDVLTLEEVAEWLSCSKMHVYRLIAGGELLAIDLASPGARRSKMRVTSDDLADYLKNRRARRARLGGTHKYQARTRLLGLYRARSRCYNKSQPGPPDQENPG